MLVSLAGHRIRRKLPDRCIDVSAKFRWEAAPHCSQGRVVADSIQGKCAVACDVREIAEARRTKPLPCMVHLAASPMIEFGVVVTRVMSKCSSRNVGVGDSFLVAIVDTSGLARADVSVDPGATHARVGQHR